MTRDVKTDVTEWMLPALLNGAHSSVTPQVETALVTVGKIVLAVAQHPSCIMNVRNMHGYAKFD